MSDLILLEENPRLGQFMELREKMGWGWIEEEVARRSIEAAAYSVCMRHDSRLAGLARVMGDGVLYFFLAEIMVDAEFHGCGTSERLMHAVTDSIDRNARPGATVTLIPLNGREPFYERFGFVRCPDQVFGAGMRYAVAPPPV